LIDFKRGGGNEKTLILPLPQGKGEEGGGWGSYPPIALWFYLAYSS